MRWGVRRFFVGALLFAFLVGLPGAAPTLASAEAVPAAQRPGFSFDYDVHSAATTAARHTRSHAFRAYDLTGNVSNSRTRSSGAVPAPKGVNEIPQVGEGIVYRRTSRMGGKPYIGQSKSAARYDARQLEHARENPFNAFDYEILGRSNPGSQLERLEEFFIRQGGGPTTRRNPAGGLANRRHQMREERYQAAGGGF